jgi:NIPSNAP
MITCYLRYVIDPNIALALFTFPSFASYEEYRAKSFQDPECQAAFRYAEDTRCIISYERSFFRPVLSAAG